ncbi:MAG: cytochrome c-type biogenesis CcmF C-terminal domain-containing protein, partial [Hyphomicrobiaceae bacterium]
LPRSVFGTVTAHFGVGLMVVGIVATSAYRSESVLVMRSGDVTQFVGYEITFEGVTDSTGANYREQIGRFSIKRNGRDTATLQPSKRAYQVPRQSTTEAGIHVAAAGDLYAVLGDAQQDQGYAVRFYFNPLVRFIWFGAVIMFIGGMLSLSDRRLRVGAPRRARSSGQKVVAAE